MSDPSAADVRAVAVAKLKRAASLPRMKDGRRPPMHDDAVSEGDKGNNIVPNGQPFSQSDDTASDGDPQQPQVEASPTIVPVAVPEEGQPIAATATVTEEEPSASGRDTPSKSKRRGRSRSRSRSRSRGSKDFKGAATSELLRPSDSSPEEQMPPVPFFAPVLASPIPSHFTTLQFHNRAFFPSPSPHHFLHTTASPPPTLDQLRAGLIRSNSARAAAMNKLTGGQEFPTGFAPGLQRVIARSNTVTGSERSAARNLMFKRIGNRTPIKESGESEVTSGVDDNQLVLDSSSSDEVSKQPSPTLSNAVIDDREPPSNTNSPTFPQPHLPPPDVEQQYETTLAKTNGEGIYPQDLQSTRGMGLPVRGPVIEENDDEDDDAPINGSPPITHQRTGSGIHPSPSRVLRYPMMSEVPSTISSTSTPTDTERVPVFLQGEGQKSPFPQDAFPVTISPVTTPVKEKEKSLRDEDEDGEKVVYLYPEEARDRKPTPNRMESNVSWIGDDLGINLNLSEVTTQQSSQPLQPLISDDAVEDQVPPVPSQEPEPVQAPQEPEPEPELAPSPASQPASQEDLTVTQPPFSNSDADERNPSRETTPSVPPETPTSTLFSGRMSASEKPSSRVETPAVNRTSHTSWTSLVAPPSASPPVRPERGVLETYTDWEDLHTDREGLTDRESSHRIERSPSRKKRESGSTTSTWDRVRSVLTGRRSRSNSFARAKKDDKLDPGANRDSSTSIRTDNGASSQPSQAPPHSSATPMLSLTTSQIPPRGAVSPVPPISPAGMARYANPKLWPQSGIVRLEQERHRQKSAATMLDDTILVPGTVPTTRVNTPEPGLAHQSSDSRLLARYRVGGENGGHTDVGDTEFETGRITPGYFDIPPSMPATPSMKQQGLPQTKEAALRWLTQHKREGKLAHSSSSTSNGHISDSGTVRQNRKRKPSLTDILDHVGGDSGAEREERIDRTSSATPRASSRRKALELLRKMAGTPTADLSSPSFTMSTASNQSGPPPKSPAQSPVTPLMIVNGHTHSYSSTTSSSSVPRPSNPPNPPQPSPLTSQAPKPPLPHTPVTSPRRPSNAAFVLGRMDSLLHDPSSCTRGGAFGHPPRSLVRSTFVRQIISPNEVKNRALLLFNDILVAAKFSDEDVDQPVLDRSMVAHNILELPKLTIQLDSERESRDFMQLDSIKSLVKQFAVNPDDAINHCLDRAQLPKDPETIGRLLYKVDHLDPSMLGIYISRRSNKAILRTFLDRFGFKGLRIDMALRVFFLTLRLPSDPGSSEHLLTTFAARWFEANKGVVSFDRDLAARLVHAIVQLNSALHQKASPDRQSSSRPATPSGSHVSARDFLYAFRHLDPHHLVTDDLLQKIYISIRNEGLVQALDRSEDATEPPYEILPSGMPETLTTRVPSQPLVFCIPNPDPNLRIHLHGQDLFFDPPVLEFSRSNQASCIITGTTLGVKDMIIVRTGANAAKYYTLPLKASIRVERSFMQNTIMIGFTSQEGVKRRYKFNFAGDDEFKEWGKSLKELKSETATMASPESTSSSRTEASENMVQRASKVLAMQTLRKALIVPDSRASSNTASPTTADGFERSKNLGPMSGHDLVTACVQNSLVPAVLNYMQVTRHNSDG